MARGSHWTRLRAIAAAMPPRTYMIDVVIRRVVVSPNPEQGGPPVADGQVIERRTQMRCAVGEQPFHVTR